MASRRRGNARAARLKMREDAVNKRPVHAGLIGGSYQPLKQTDLEKIHQTALEVLETIGIGDPTPEVVEIATAAGCRIDENGRLCFPKSLIEDIVAGAAREYTIYSRSPNHDDVKVGGYHVNYSTSGEAVSIYEPGQRSFRPSTLVWTSMTTLIVFGFLNLLESYILLAFALGVSSLFILQVFRRAGEIQPGRHLLWALFLLTPGGWLLYLRRFPHFHGLDADAARLPESRPPDLTGPPPSCQPTA